MAEPTGSIIRMPQVLNSMGTSTIAAPSQLAVNTAIAELQPKGDYATNTALNSKLDKAAVVQTTGSSTTSVMSQKAVTDAFQPKGSYALKSEGYPIGAPIPWPQSTPPSGFLVCNGQSFNKAAYPLLAKAYPSGVLPDLRGEFIRGLDAGRNIDSNRTVLSPQGDAIRNITGEFGNNGLAHRNSGWSGQASGAFAKNRGGVYSNREVDWAGCTYTFDASRVVPTANENRPRNIAFLYIVRAA